MAAEGTTVHSMSGGASKLKSLPASAAVACIKCRPVRGGEDPKNSDATARRKGRGAYSLLK